MVGGLGVGGVAAVVGRDHQDVALPHPGDEVGKELYFFDRMFFFKYFSTSSLQGRKFLLESRKLENVTAFVNLFL